MEITGVDDFKGRLRVAENAGLTHDEALVFLQMKQQERHHTAVMKKLDSVGDWVRAIRENRGPFYG